MTAANNLPQVSESINTGAPLLIYFSGKKCPVCKALKPKIEMLIEKEFPKLEMFEVKAELQKEITGHFMIFSVPVILVFFEGKEYFRKGGNMSIAEFKKELGRPYELMFG